MFESLPAILLTPALSLSVAVAPAVEDELYEAFRDPPAEARPFVRWWWNGDCVTERELLRELDILAAAGIGGVEINPIAMPDGASATGAEALEWLSPEWNRMAGVAARGARERGMLADMIVGSGWPFGGRFLESGETIQAIGVSRTTIEGPTVFEARLEEITKPPKVRNVVEGAADPRLVYLRLVPRNATGIGDCVDVMDRVAPDGTVELEIPPGEHTLHAGMWRESFTAVVHGAPGSDGQVLDHLNSAAVERYLRRMSSALGPALGGRLGDGLRAMFCDSIELSGANWTTDFPEQFHRRRGYRLEPWLPFALYDPHTGYEDPLPEDEGFADEVRRVRYDFNKTFVELFHERFIEVFHAWCHENGVLSRYQAYGSPGLMDMLSGYTIPDIPEGDTWLFFRRKAHLPLDEIRYAVWNKHASSGAHLAGRKLVGCEAMTNLHGVFQATLEYIKQAGDLNLMCGVNHSILHGFNYSPPEAGFPGWIRYGTYFNENNPWWPHFREWADYNARLCGVLQASQPRAEVAILGPTADVWQRSGVERQGFIHSPPYLHLLWQAIQQNGSTADFVSEGALRDATFEDGRIRHDPMVYDLLVVAGVHALEPGTAKVIEEYAKAGGRIAFVGHIPDASPGWKDREENDRFVQEAVAAALDEDDARAALIAEPAEGELIDWVDGMLDDFDVRRPVHLSAPHPRLFQVHHRAGERELFLFSNQSRTDEIRVHSRFATGERIPWRWDPETGERTVFPHGERRNELDLALRPLESLLLVFEPELSGAPVRRPEIDREKGVEVAGPWQLFLAPVVGDPFRVTLDELLDLGASPDERLDAFAGEVTYRLTLDVADPELRMLSLGVVHGTSEVSLDGEALGVRWWGAEHLYDVTDRLKIGANELEVKVTTVLSNYCRTLEDNPAAMRWASRHQPVPVGLIGPVRLFPFATGNEIGRAEPEGRGLATPGSVAERPHGLMCELLARPEDTTILDAAPEISWIVGSPEANDFQTGYRIRVTADGGPVWDSGRVESGRSVAVEYAGEPLEAGGTYAWQVKTWTERTGESPWSEVQRFTLAEDPSGYATSRYPLVQSPLEPVVVRALGEGHYFVDFGKVAFGTLTLELDSPIETDLEIHLAERGSPEGVNRSPGGTVRYVEVSQPIQPGWCRYRVELPPDRRNTGEKAIPIPEEIGVILPFRYCEILNCPVELTPAMIRQVAVHYPFDESAASFTSSDEVLNQIWELCKYSMKATSFCGVYVDGDRERIPYEADAYINQLSHYAVDREFTLARHSHEYLLHHPTWPTEWKQHSVMIAWADYLYTGDIESLTQHYALLRSEKTLDWRAREDGLLDTEGLRDIVDWPKGERDGFDFKPINTVVNAFHFENLNLMQQVAELLGRDADAAAYRVKASLLYQAFNAKLFDAERGVYVDGEGSTHASLHANMMALAFDLVPQERLDSVVDHVLSRGMACSVYGAQYLLEGLYRAGRADEAFALLTSKEVRSWYNMIRVGSTITLEAWDDRYKPNQDWNHAWGAVPGNIIPRYLLGVRPLEGGFGKVLVRPMPGPLERAQATIPTIRGTIDLSIVNEPGEPFELKLSIPANMEARVEVPLPGGRGEVTVDGRRVSFRPAAGFAVFERVGSGQHVFRTTEDVSARR